ncbi:hypothetical protein [Acinetobacter brisouii]|uniref:hypothetical protein n=1 Tax=Acinetobacter brisouii TaxID=396323 RepID=UPI0005F7D333|nr:hypothetical protein [Acinetobacter brisouii]KJV38547.1 hypothetical protein VH98_08940 [Acinetobacter brisouii]
MKKNLYVIFLLLTFSNNAFSEKIDQAWKNDKFVYTQIFQREYTQEHLHGNPLQRVTKIFVKLDFIPREAKLARKDLGAGFEDDRDKILMSLYVKYLDRTNWYQQEAICNKIKNNYICNANITDGGNFILDFNSKNQIFLDFSENNSIPLEECVKGAWENSEGKVSTLTNKYGKGEKFILYKNNNIPISKIISKNCFDF